MHIHLYKNVYTAPVMHNESILVNQMTSQKLNQNLVDFTRPYLQNEGQQPEKANKNIFHNR